MKFIENHSRLIFPWIVISFCVILIIIAIFIYKPKITNKNYTLTLPQNSESNYVLNQQLEIYKNDLKDEYNQEVEQLNNKFNIIMGLLGVAITTWVGLNIYNFIDKRELENLTKKHNEDVQKINQLQMLVNKEIIDNSKYVSDIYNNLVSIMEKYGKIDDLSSLVDILIEKSNKKDEIYQLFNERKENLSKLMKVYEERQKKENC